MNDPSALFEVPPRYVIDTNVIVSFLHGTDDEYYDKNVMPAEWGLFERLIASGEIVAPRRVEVELHGWERVISEMKRWVNLHKHMFRDQTNEQLSLAKRIVNDYPDYGSSQNYVGDLEVLSLGGILGVPIITLERVRVNPTRNQPKIPEVCATYGFACLSVTGFLREEMKRKKAS